MVKATSLLQVRNDRVIVTEWRFAPGAETGAHVHAHDYVVVPLTSGTLRLEETGGRARSASRGRRVLRATCRGRPQCDQRQRL
jgi:quercetin dioxygenase-like cupin family protein